jgi:arabinogalactan endo-1,4-beta-galactosidase
VNHLSNHSLVLGADLSLAKRVLDAGATFEHRGQRRDLLELLAESGLRCARLRLFNEPTGHGAQVNDLAYTLELAAQLRDHGFSLYLAPHYSDGWADPGKQFPPRAWQGLSFPQLVDAVRRYSRDTMRAFALRGLVPAIVQVGNEITPGMLWEHGRIAPAHGTGALHWDPRELANVEKENWRRFGALLKASIEGIHEGLAPATTQVMLHIDRGGDWDACRWFFDNIAEQRVPHDLIGLSYYPFWHGMPADLEHNCREIIARYDQDVVLAEVAYPHAAHPFYEAVLEEDPRMWRRITEAYPLTPEGQRRFVRDVGRIATALPAGRCRGIYYWAPEWIPVAGAEDEAEADVCWARALFDAGGRALPALDAFREIASELDDNDPRSPITERTPATAQGAPA